MEKTIIPFQPFPYPGEISRILCSDFDETWRPHLPANQQNSGIEELEEYLLTHINPLHLLIGWITGSTLQAIFRKCTGYARYFPHFIASSLGTELYLIRGNQISPCQEWITQINDSGFLLENIPKAVEEVTAQGIQLFPQPADYQGKFTRSFYYKDCPTSQTDLLRMGEVAIEYRMKLTYSLCNPAAGDPEGYYDLQFLPSCTGKDKVLEFLCNLWQVNPENTWAVGDSFNDLRMIQSAAHGYYLVNADPKVLEYYPVQTALPYCRGIKEIISQI